MTTYVNDDRLQHLPKDIAILHLVADAENKHLILKVFARAKFPRTLWNARGICELPGFITAPARFRAATCATLATLNNVCNVCEYRIEEGIDD